MDQKACSHFFPAARSHPPVGFSHGPGFSIAWGDGPNGERRDAVSGASEAVVLEAVLARIAEYRKRVPGYSENALVVSWLTSAIEALNRRDRRQEGAQKEPGAAGDPPLTLIEPSSAPRSGSDAEDEGRETLLAAKDAAGLRLSLVVAKTADGVIGKDGGLPWGRISEDLRKFREITLGSPLILGRKTYESLAGALPGRVCIVLSRRWRAYPPGVVCARTPAEAIAIAGSMAGRAYVAGGAEIYHLFGPLCDAAHVTYIARDYAGDVKFPDLSFKPPEWRVIWSESLCPDVAYTWFAREPVTAARAEMPDADDYDLLGLVMHVAGKPTEVGIVLDVRRVIRMDDISRTTHQCLLATSQQTVWRNLDRLQRAYRGCYILSGTLHLLDAYAGILDRYGVDSYESRQVRDWDKADWRFRHDAAILASAWRRRAAHTASAKQRADRHGKDEVDEKSQQPGLRQRLGRDVPL